MEPRARAPGRPGVTLPDRAAYERDGFVAVRGLVDSRTLSRLSQAADRVVAAGSGLIANAVIGGAKFQVQSRSGRPEEGAIEPGVLRKVTFPHLLEGVIAGFQNDPRMVAVIESLGVRSPRCLVDQINLKAALVGTRFPWHQDLSFLGKRQQEMVARHGGMNVLLALDAADEENGAFEVLGGTHLHGLSAITYDLGAETEGVYDASRRTVLSMAPGDAVFFHPLLAHGSPPNASSRPRRMLAFWFAGTGRKRGGSKRE